MGMGGGAMPLPIFFLPNNSFLLATELKRGKQKNGEKRGSGVCM